MTEQEYITASSWACVRHVQQLLGDLTQENIPQIPREEWTQVHRILDRWNGALFRALQIDDEPGPPA